MTGWAADLHRPNDPVDIVVIVNGERIAQVTCDMLRTDLRDLGTYGEGKHGFRYEFSPPLPEDVEIGLTIRSANSGIALVNGDLVFPRQSAEAVAVPPQSPFVIPAPADPASLFRLFNCYEKTRGLSSILYRSDFRNTRRAQLDYAVYGEFGSDIIPGRSWTEQEARDHLESLLYSARFQRHIITHVLRAFPEKRRFIFLHIPKCAGTDLTSHLETRHPAVSKYWAEESWTKKADLFLSLANLIRDLQFSSSIFASGHVTLNYYSEHRLIRPADRIFTVIRDPVEIAISAVNYLLTRLEYSTKSKQIDPDVKNWTSLLGIGAIPRPMTSQFIDDISARALRNIEIVRPNSLCYWLGGGSFESVVGRLAQNHVEITNTANYAAWLEEEWGINTKIRANVSNKYLSTANLSRNELDYIENVSSEDRKFYNLVCNRLKFSGRSSIFGEDLL